MATGMFKNDKSGKGLQQEPPGVPDSPDSIPLPDSPPPENEERVVVGVGGGGGGGHQPEETATVEDTDGQNYNSEDVNNMPIFSSISSRKQEKGSVRKDGKGVDGVAGLQSDGFKGPEKSQDGEEDDEDEELDDNNRPKISLVAEICDDEDEENEDETESTHQSQVLQSEDKILNDTLDSGSVAVVQNNGPSENDSQQQPNQIEAISGRWKIVADEPAETPVTETGPAVPPPSAEKESSTVSQQQHSTVSPAEDEPEIIEIVTLNIPPTRRLRPLRRRPFLGRSGLENGGEPEVIDIASEEEDPEIVFIAQIRSLHPVNRNRRRPSPPRRPSSGLLESTNSETDNREKRLSRSSPGDSGPVRPGRHFKRPHSTSSMSNCEEGEITDGVNPNKKRKKDKKKMTKRSKSATPPPSSSKLPEKMLPDSIAPLASTSDHEESSSSGAISWRKPSKRTQNRNNRGGNAKADDTFLREKEVEEKQKNSSSSHRRNRTSTCKERSPVEEALSIESDCRDGSPSNNRSHSKSPAGRSFKRSKNKRSVTRSRTPSPRSSHKKNRKPESMDRQQRQKQIKEKEKQQQQQLDESLSESKEKRQRKEKEKSKEEESSKQPKEKPKEMEKKKRREKSPTPVKAIVPDGDSIVVSLSFQKGKTASSASNAQPSSASIEERKENGLDVSENTDSTGKPKPTTPNKNPSNDAVENINEFNEEQERTQSFPAKLSSVTDEEGSATPTDPNTTERSAKTSKPEEKETQVTSSGGGSCGSNSPFDTKRSFSVAPDNTKTATPQPSEQQDFSFDHTLWSSLSPTAEGESNAQGDSLVTSTGDSLDPAVHGTGDEAKSNTSSTPSKQQTDVSKLFSGLPHQIAASSASPRGATQTSAASAESNCGTVTTTSTSSSLNSCSTRRMNVLGPKAQNFPLQSNFRGGTNNSSFSQGQDLGGGGESPMSPNSSEGDDLFEPPTDRSQSDGGKMGKNGQLFGCMPIMVGGTANANDSFNSATAGGNKPKERNDLFDTLFGGNPGGSKKGVANKPEKVVKCKVKHRTGGPKKEAIKANTTKGLTEGEFRLIDDMASSAVELVAEQKYLKKLNRQERVVDEVKIALNPFYNNGQVNKDEYKEILRRAVPKIYRHQSGIINPTEIKKLVEAYVKKFRHARERV